MKICLYSPYLPDHTGGGEKYLFDVAEVLSQKHEVVMAINQPLTAPKIQDIKHKYETFLNRSLKKISFVSTPVGTESNLVTKLLWTKAFDVMYYQTDGSLFFSLARKNILHIQVPLKLDKSGWLEQLKLANWNVKNTNSEFTKSVVEKSWPTKIDVVHHPLVELGTTKPFEPEKKAKVILNVGRFFTQLHAKRQDVMVKMFTTLIEKNSQISRGWKLVLIGGVEDQAFTDQISKQAQNLPIEIYHSVSRDQLIEWYQRASIYWHAAGFNVDQAEHPEKVEHFGISTAEAMLAGAAPVVIGKGGQPEILGDDLQNWLWQTEAECLEKTLMLMEDKQLRTEVQAVAHDRAHTFGREPFERKLEEMISA
jgi:glycosyltransferase involved in cell wall biosynthesis